MLTADTQRTPHNYNATATWLDATGKVVSVEAVQVTDGKVTRACGHSCYESGTPAFDAVWRKAAECFHTGHTLRIDLDGAAGYRAALRGLVPPSYLRS